MTNPIPNPRLVARATACFGWLDTERRGELGASEFARPLARVRAALETHGLVARPDAIEAADEAEKELFGLLLLCVDADRSGTVSADEFAVFAAMLAEQTAEHGGRAPPWVVDFVRTLVALVDADASADLDAREYVLLVEALAPPSAPPRFEDLAGSTGRVSLAELDVRIAAWFAT